MCMHYPPRDSSDCGECQKILGCDKVSFEEQISHSWFSKAALDVTNERRRQVEKLGYDCANDDRYTNDLVHAAMWFITGEDLQWPWSQQALNHVKSKNLDKRASLVRAAALLIAEIERIDRATTPA